MADGRRHSVDIPISRTLVALRRVRSLRDPCTNSMSKFSTLLENVNWESSSNNEISLQFMDGCQGGGCLDHNGPLGRRNLGLNGQRKEQVDDFELQCPMEKPKSKLNSCENMGVVENIGAAFRSKMDEGMDNCGLNQEEICANKVVVERHYCNYANKGMASTGVVPLRKHLEDVDSANEPTLGFPKEESLDQSMSRPKLQYKNQHRSYGVVDDVLSCAGSPCLSISDALSNHSTSLFANEEADFVVWDDDQGCGISSCWTRTPRFRGLNLYSDVERHCPLLSRGVAEITLCEQSSWKHISHETPRSLSQKFRPKSFDELVGQSVVSRSLLGAISRGRITTLYLFHGPRGTGKTSASRIFAAALNCLSLEQCKPCGICQECVFFFSGRSKDVKEVDSVRINRAERIRTLIKSAAKPPLTSRFKVFIFDECHLLHGETWATILSSLDNLSQRVVFVMITPDLDKLPRSAITHSQRYHFPKIKDVDIASRLRSICVKDGLDFDQVALDVIAAKSNGSLRDAEMMLDQLTLLGKRITMTLVYELIGVVSDDELLDLLDLALSSDTANTVIRARELMRSRIDPMQLVSQLANLIMDVLAGKCKECSSEAGKKFLRRHASEVNTQRLSHALKILSETEKQLRVSKSQSTWLTVALLQLSSLESSSPHANDSKSSLRHAHDRGGDFCSTSSTGGSLKHIVPCLCEESRSCKLGIQRDQKATLELIWNRATELCQPNSLKNFLRKQGKLLSLCVNQDLVVAELEFHHPDHVSKAEKSWKLIASSLQSILCCNVEIRINLVLCAPVSKSAKLRKLSFSLFSCSRRMQLKSQSSMERGSDTDNSDCISEKPMIRDKTILTFSSDCGSLIPQNCDHRMEGVRALRNKEGNVLSIGTSSSHRLSHDETSKTPGYGVHSLKEDGRNLDCQELCSQETEDQPNCFPRSLRFQKRFRPESSQVICMDNQQENELEFSISGKKSFEGYINGNDSFVFGSDTSDFRNEHGLKENSISLCWRTPTIPLKKAWHHTQDRQRSPLVWWVLPCGIAK